MSLFDAPTLAPTITGLRADVDPPTRTERMPVIEDKRPRRRGEDAGTVELIIRFCAWAHERRHFPSAREIQNRFSVSRANAYRWRRALADVYGIEPPSDRDEDAE